MTILAGEGLINDATALVAFNVASSIAVTGTVFSPALAAGRVAYAAAMAILVGVAVGWVGRQLLRRVGDPAIRRSRILSCCSCRSAHSSLRRPSTPPACSRW